MRFLFGPIIRECSPGASGPGESEKHKGISYLYAYTNSSNRE
jgi:hypothetical protein